MFVAAGFALVVGFWVSLGYFAWRAANHVAEHGLKSTAEQLWEGPQE